MDHSAIVDLVGNNYEQLISQIFVMKEKERRISLLKVVIDLILEATPELCSNQMVF
jgi:hypothetical protein